MLSWKEPFYNWNGRIQREQSTNGASSRQLGGFQPRLEAYKRGFRERFKVSVESQFLGILKESDGTFLDLKRQSKATKNAQSKNSLL